MDRISSFGEFWPVYLRAHADPRCRALHYGASAAGIAGLLAAIATMSLWPILAGMIVGYALAWAGHLFMERNLPLTFRYPLWSFAADYRMFARWLTGRLDGDLRRAGA